MSFLKTLFLGAVLVALSSGSAFASCFGPAEYEAEQGLRIHSELMVIGLTCQKMPGGGTLYRKYQTFTTKNQDLIAGYEEHLISFYRQEGDSQPEGELNTLRTVLANQISTHAVQMSMTSFCQHFSSRIDKALGMNEGTLRKWARQEWPNIQTSRPRCSRRSY